MDDQEPTPSPIREASTGEAPETDAPTELTVDKPPPPKPITSPKGPDRPELLSAAPRPPKPPSPLRGQ